MEAYTGTDTWSRLVYGDERVGYRFMLDGSQAAHGTYGYDHQGSTITTPDASASVGHDPFGTPVGPPATDLFFGCRGELHVGDTIHLRNRDYDPTLASRDLRAAATYAALGVDADLIEDPGPV